MLGDCLANVGRVDEGIAAVRNAGEMNPGATVLREWLAKKYSESGSTELAKAEMDMVERIRGSKVPVRAEDFN